jgi:hypothetical protein
MKAILEFDLPEEKQAHDYAVNATEAFGALADIQQKIRSIRKYGADIESTLDEIEHIVMEINWKYEQ